MRRDAFHWNQNKGERRLRLIERRRVAVAGHSQLDHRDFRCWHFSDLVIASRDVRSSVQADLAESTIGVGWRYRLLA